MTAALLDDLDRALMRATQTGLPLVSEPFKALAEQLGTTEDDILARFRRWDGNGVLRRCGVSSGSPTAPVAYVNSPNLPVATDVSSFGSVKSLFR